MGQAVPYGERFSRWGELHGSPTSTKSVAVPVAHRLPSVFRSKDLRDQCVAFEDDFPWGPNGIVVCEGGIQRNARREIRPGEKPLDRMGFPEGMNATLSCSLAVVVARCMKGNMGVSEVMAQIGCRAHNPFQIGLRAV